MRNILGFLAILALLLSALTSANIQSGASRTAFTPEDALTIKVNGVDYTLGRSTPADFAANGWEMFQESDGTFSFLWPAELSYFYVGTADHQPDSPMTSINLMWADGVTVIYPGGPDHYLEYDEAFWQWVDSEWITGVTEYGSPTAQLSLPDGRTLMLEAGSGGLDLALVGEEQ